MIAPTSVALLAPMLQSQRTGLRYGGRPRLRGIGASLLRFRNWPQPSLADCWAQQAEKVVTLGLRVHIAKLVEAQLLSMASISSSDRLVLMMMCKVLPSARLPRPLGHTFGKCS